NLCRQIVDSLRCQPPVLKVQSASCDLVGRIGPPQYGKQRNTGPYRDEHHSGCRKQPLDQLCVEVNEVYGARALDLSEQESSDQEPRDDKEHVDADVASWKHRRPQVEYQNRNNGYRANALDFWSKGPGLRILDIASQVDYSCQVRTLWGVDGLRNVHGGSGFVVEKFRMSLPAPHEHAYGC